MYLKPGAAGDAPGNEFSNDIAVGSAQAVTDAAQAARPAYYFNIGSVDSFERRLDEAQMEVGLRPQDYVPVKVSVSFFGT